MPPITPQDRKPKKTATPRKRAAATVEVTDPESKYAPTVWGSQTGVAEDLVVPSGQTCLVRRPGVQGLMEAGILRDLDSLTGIVDSEHIKRVKGGKRVDVSSLVQNPENLSNALHLMDRVIEHVVMKPTVTMAPNDITMRKPGVIYTDMIDIQDKVFIFNFAVGGTRSLETFRDELESAMGSVDS